VGRKGSLRGKRKKKKERGGKKGGDDPLVTSPLARKLRKGEKKEGRTILFLLTIPPIHDVIGD